MSKLSKLEHVTGQSWFRDYPECLSSYYVWLYYEISRQMQRDMAEWSRSNAVGHWRISQLRNAGIFMELDDAVAFKMAFG